MSSDDTFRGTNYTIRHTSAGQYFISHPQGNETFDSFEEFVDSHPITEEARKYFFGTTIRVVTAAGINSTALGDAYSAYDGVSWRNSVDNADSDGCGRVFLDCDSAEVTEYVSERLEADDRVDAYEIA